jgi:hypothetical protein
VASGVGGRKVRFLGRGMVVELVEGLKVGRKNGKLGFWRTTIKNRKKAVGSVGTKCMKCKIRCGGGGIGKNCGAYTC